MMDRLLILLSNVILVQCVRSIDYTVCSWEGYGCYGVPTGCEANQTCTGLATFMPYGIAPRITFNLDAYLSNDEYAAVGLSYNADMTDSFVRFCNPVGDDWSVYEGYGVDGDSVPGSCHVYGGRYIKQDQSVFCGITFHEMETVNVNGKTHAYDFTIPMYVSVFIGSVGDLDAGGCPNRLPPTDVMVTDKMVKIIDHPHHPVGHH